jgi:hypothetical protein
LATGQSSTGATNPARVRGYDRLPFDGGRDAALEVVG